LVITEENIKKMSFKINKINQESKIKTPILIEGLPGIGNVGKIALDFMIENLNAKKIYEIKSKKFPNSVFINEANLAELPKIEIYHKRIKNQDLIFLSGDIQPIEDESCYDFCEKILDLFQTMKGKEIITLGGIGLSSPPENPKVFCTGNSKEIIKKYQKNNQLNNNLFGLVGPIMGVSGLLLGLGKERKIPSISLLAETYGHPSYLGIKGAREILKKLNKSLSLNINLKDLDKEIKEIEKEIKNINALQELNKKPKRQLSTNYIG
jgi:hypothetical protein